MALFSPSQVAPGAVDEAGLSVTTAPRRAGDPRYGTFYDTATLAASTPVHFHPLNAEQYLMLFSRRWHTATPSSGNPGGYTAYTEDLSAGWVRVAVPSGQRVALGETYAVPTQGGYAHPQLIDAVSRSNEYVYLLLAVSGAGAVLAHWCHNTTTGAIIELAEELIPTSYCRPETITALAWAGLTEESRRAAGMAVTFNRGLHFRSPHLVVFGTGANNQLFMARKPWGRIGVNRNVTAPTLYRNQVGETADDPRWYYFTGEGWSADATLAAPVRTAAGVPLTTLGPVSTAIYRDYTLLATVAANGPARVARIYVQRGERGWSAAEPVVPLGSIDGSYLGENLRFQQHVMARLSGPAMTNPDVEVAVPYVVSTKTVVSGVSTLHNTWGLWEMARPGSARMLVPTDTLGATLAASVAFFTDASVIMSNDDGSLEVPRTIQVVNNAVVLGAASDYVIFVNGPNGAVTLPTALGNTYRYTIKNIYTADKIISTTSSQTIDGSPNWVLTPETAVEIFSDGTNWRVF